MSKTRLYRMKCGCECWKELDTHGEEHISHVICDEHTGSEVHMLPPYPITDVEDAIKYFDDLDVKEDKTPVATNPPLKEGDKATVLFKGTYNRATIRGPVDDFRSRMRLTVYRDCEGVRVALTPDGEWLVPELCNGVGMDKATIISIKAAEELAESLWDCGIYPPVIKMLLRITSKLMADDKE